MSFDFKRAKDLMDFIVAAGQHGPAYQRVKSEAEKELRKMIEDLDGVHQPAVITPPEGPANSLVNEDPRNEDKLPEVEEQPQYSTPEVKRKF